MIFTVQYGTYSFPNQTFEIEGHRYQTDTPVNELRRRNGAKVLDGNLKSKKYKIKGMLYGNDVDSVHNALNIMLKSIHNQGTSAYLKYRADRQVLSWLSSEGFDAPYKKGLYGSVMDVTVNFVAAKPYAEDVNLTTVTGSRTNNSAIETLTNLGNYPTNPIFTFIAGASPFFSDIYVQNNGNSNYFRYQGNMLAGQTLVVNCDAGCVLLHQGLTMIDAISLFGGDLFFEIIEGQNLVVIDTACLTYSIGYRNRWYA